MSLESALEELRGLRIALTAARERDRLGRELVRSSARNGDLTDRLAGEEESEIARRLGAFLTQSIAGTELSVATLRQEFLSKRVERRQAEALIREAEAQDALEQERRVQHLLDDWYRTRPQRQERSAEEAGQSAHGLAISGVKGQKARE